MIGDLGLTEAQRAALRSELIDLRCDGSFREMCEAGYILATHKPAAIREVIRRFGLPCLALDADMLLTARLHPAECGGADIAVTPRMRRRAKRFEDHRNGYLNSGFFYAAATPEASSTAANPAEKPGGRQSGNVRALAIRYGFLTLLLALVLVFQLLILQQLPPPQVKKPSHKFTTIINLAWGKPQVFFMEHPLSMSTPSAIASIRRVRSDP